MHIKKITFKLKNRTNITPSYISEISKTRAKFS